MRYKVLLFVLSCLCFVGAQNLNYNGFLDTSNITTFRADSLKYSKAFPLSQLENFVLDVCVNDTSAAKFAGDSVKFYWWIERGHPALNAAGTLDTIWNTINPLLVDTFFVTAGKYTQTFATLGTDGSFLTTAQLIDTTSLADFMVQSRSFAPPFDVLVRVGHKGLTGNEKGSFLVLRDAVYRRAAVRVRQN